MSSGTSFYGTKEFDKVYLGSTQIIQIYFGDKNVYDGGFLVYYHIDTNNIVTVPVPPGADCLDFAPEVSIPNYTFHGWREDTAASPTVLSTRVCDRLDIHLYAVVKQTITLSYNGNGNTGGSTANQTGTKYYNNGNILRASFTLRTCGFTKTDYRFTKWAEGSTSGTQYDAGATVTLIANTIFYACWITNIPLNVLYENSYSRSGNNYATNGSGSRTYTQTFNTTGVRSITVNVQYGGYADTENASTSSWTAACENRSSWSFVVNGVTYLSANDDMWDRDNGGSNHNRNSSSANYTITNLPNGDCDFNYGMSWSFYINGGQGGSANTYIKFKVTNVVYN